jgi:hypothetical protein
MWPIHSDSDLYVLVRLRPRHEDLADDREDRQVGVSAAPIHIEGDHAAGHSERHPTIIEKMLAVVRDQNPAAPSGNVAWKPSSLPTLRASCVVTTLTSIDRSQLIAHAEISSSRTGAATVGWSTIVAARSPCDGCACQAFNDRSRRMHGQGLGAKRMSQDFGCDR